MRTVRPDPVSPYPFLDGGFATTFGEAFVEPCSSLALVVEDGPGHPIVFFMAREATGLYTARSFEDFTTPEIQAQCFPVLSRFSLCQRFESFLVPFSTFPCSSSSYMRITPNGPPRPSHDSQREMYSSTSAKLVYSEADILTMGHPVSSKRYIFDRFYSVAEFTGPAWARIGSVRGSSMWILVAKKTATAEKRTPAPMTVR